MSLFFVIEYIKVRLSFVEYNGFLVVLKIIDEMEVFE